MMKLCTSLMAAVALVLATGLSAAATDLYWDINGATAGGTDDGGGIGDGTWVVAATPGDYNGNTVVDAADYVVWRNHDGQTFQLQNEVAGTTPGTVTIEDYDAWRANFGNTPSTNLNWNPVANGTGTTQAWTDGNKAIFSAGSNVTDAIVTITGVVKPSEIEVQEGKVLLTGASPSINVGSGAIKVDNGATLQIANVLQLVLADNHVTTLDGGTLSNKLVGAGSTFWGYVTLGPTTVHPTFIELTANGGTMNVPNGAGGDGINSAYSIMQYPTNPSPAGPSIIRMASGVTAATLHKTGHGEFRASANWTFTTLDVQSGLYRILAGSSGGADTGFGDVNGTVYVAGGAAENTTNGAAVGTTQNLTSDAGGAGPSPATRSFVLTGVGDTIDSTFVLNSNWQILGNISGPGGLMLNGWERNDAGAFIGAANELRLNGNNTYGGNTTINFGTIVAQSGTAIPNTSAVIFSTRSLWGNGTQSTQNTAVLRVDASETVGSLAGGVTGVRGTVNINGAGVTLTTGADNTTTTFSGTISGAGSLVKSGTGQFNMNGTKTYTGSTSVLAGILSTNSASLADLADVLMTTGGVFDLNFAGTDTINRLFFDGVSQAIGTWGGAGSGATNISAFFTGTGTLTVSTFPGSGSSLNPGSVPEPTSLALLVVGVVMGLATGRRR